MASSRDTIKQRIALDGGKEIKDQLKGLGEDGERAFQQIRDAIAKANASPLEKLSKAVDGLKKQFASLSAAGARIKTDWKDFNSAQEDLGKSFDKTVKKIGLVTAAIAGAATGFVLFVKSGADAADEVGKQAQRLGLTIDQYQKLKFATGQNAVSVETLSTAMNFFNKLLGKTKDEAASTAKLGFGALDSSADDLGITVVRVGDNVAKLEDDTVSGATAFQHLGIKIRDANNAIRPAFDIITDLAGAFAKLPDGAEKSALAAALFGKAAGPDLIPFLNQGKAGVDALFTEFERLGISITDLDVKTGDAAIAAFSKLGVAIEGLKNKIGLIFAPDLAKGADQLTELLGQNSAAIKAFANDVAQKAVPVVKDLFNALIGSDSLVVDKRFLEWRDGIIEFGKYAATVVAGLAGLFRFLADGPLQFVADGLNKLFGTQLNGAIILASIGLLKFLGVFKLVGSAFGVVRTGFVLLFNLLRGIGPLLGTIGSSFSVIVSGFGAIAEGVGFLIGVFADAIAAAAAFVAGLVGWPVLLVAALAAAIVAIVAFWPQVSAAAQVAWDAIVAAAAATWAALVAGASGVAGAIASAFGGLGSLLSGVWSGIVADAQNAWNTIIAGAEAAARAIASVFNQAKSSPDGGSGGGGFAGGGFVRGRGTSTSDSIPAWLSDGEFVIRAAAVKKYGLELFRRLNGLGDAGMRLKEGFGGFAGGGLARGGVSIGGSLDGLLASLANSLGAGLGGPTLAIAGAGPSLAAPQRARTPITLVLPGGETLNFESDDATAARLMRFGSRKSTSQAGRKPGWQR